MSKDDQDVERYKAALKRSSFEFPRHMRGVTIAVVALGVGVGAAWWNDSTKKAKAAEAKAIEEARDAKEREERWAQAGEERKRQLSPIESSIKTYAELDTTALPEGPIELTTGRRVLSIDTLWKIADEDFRIRLKVPPEGEKRRSLFEPEGWDASEAAGVVALKDEDVGIVVLVSSTVMKVGTYKNERHDAKYKDLPGLGALYSFVAVAVPERKVVARWRHFVEPPSSIRVSADGIPMGDMPFGTLRAATYRSFLDALRSGRAPKGSED
jgi:hypothetical protein